MSNLDAGDLMVFALCFALLLAAVWLFIKIGLLIDRAITAIFNGIARLFGIIIPSNTRDLSSNERTHLIKEAEAYIHDWRLLIVACMAKFAKIDGVVTKNELTAVEEALQILELKGEERLIAIDVFRLAKTGKATFRSCVALYFETHENDPDGRLVLIGTLLAVAHADGEPNLRTSEALAAACQWLGFDYRACLENYQHNRQQAKSTNATREQAEASGIEAAYKVLGCQPTDSPAAVKDRYRKLVKDFHPDTIMSKGLPAEFVKFAEDRFKQIQAAYDTVMESQAKQRV